MLGSCGVLVTKTKNESAIHTCICMYVYLATCYRLARVANFNTMTTCKSAAIATCRQYMYDRQRPRPALDRKITLRLPRRASHL